MANLFPIQQQQEYPIFGRFNVRYGDTLADNCPPLQEFQIAIFTKEEFEANPRDLLAIDLDENDAFACSRLTEEEQYAAIAHEIGHIIYRFSDKKEQFPKGQGEEIFADSIAAEIGLANEILSVIEKMEKEFYYDENKESRFGMRKKYLKCMCIDILD